MILFHASRVGVIAAVATTAEGAMLSRDCIAAGISVGATAASFLPVPQPAVGSSPGGPPSLAMIGVLVTPALNTFTRMRRSVPSLKKRHRKSTVSYKRSWRIASSWRSLGRVKPPE
jgi:hypothetical protein